MFYVQIDLVLCISVSRVLQASGVTDPLYLCASAIRRGWKVAYDDFKLCLPPTTISSKPLLVFIIMVKIGIGSLLIYNLIAEECKLGTVRSNVVKDIFDVIFLFINEFRCLSWAEGFFKDFVPRIYTQFVLYLNQNALFIFLWPCQKLTFPCEVLGLQIYLVICFPVINQV